MVFKPLFCEITSYWDWPILRSQICEHYFCYPIELMIQKGFKTEVLTTLTSQKDQKQCEEYENLSIYRFMKVNTPPHILSFGIHVFSHIAERRYSLIHVHNINGFADVASWIASRVKNTPMVFTSHNHDAFERFLASEPSASPLRQKISQKWFVKDSPTCVFTAFTKTQAQIYQRLGINNVEIIPHGIDPKVFEVQLDHTIVKKHNLDEFNILCVGVIDPRKGQHFLVSSMPSIIKEYPHTRLILVGRSFQQYQREHLHMLRNQVRSLDLQEKVIFIDNISRDELIQLYLASSVFALPTRAEMFGLVFLEAMGAGLPIVSTNTPHIKEILGDGKAGILVERERKSIENAILTLLGDEPIRKKMGNNGKKLVHDKYCLDDVIQKYWQLYEKIMAVAQNPG